MNSPLFSRTGLRYEVALDILGAIIAHWSAEVAIERDATTPDAEKIAHATQEKTALRSLRDELDPNDKEAIENVIEKYSQQARDFYKL